MRGGSACGTVLVLALSGCNEQNTYVAPPPPKVDVALPVKQDVTAYLNATGNTVAVNDTTLVARVQGFIQEIDYSDGDAVKAGTTLFVIEPEPYQLALEQAQSSHAAADASAKQSQADFERQQALVTKGVATQQDLDKASAQRDADAAKQKQTAADVKQAELNLSYTQVKAPFDGIATARQVSMGQLVAAGTTTLASVVQLNPIYVSFNVSELDVQRVRANMAKRGLTPADLKKIPVEVGLQGETDYPYKGMLDYAAPADHRVHGHAAGSRHPGQCRPPAAARLFRARAGAARRRAGPAAGAGPRHRQRPERALCAGRRQGRHRRTANGRDRPAGRRVAGDRLRHQAGRPRRHIGPAGRPCPARRSSRS